LIIVAFAGVARGGKTTAARLLHDWCMDHDLKPIIMSFAQPMKEAAKRIGLSKDTNPELYRKTLQRWGESRRDPAYKPGITGPDYWVNRSIKTIARLADAEKAEYMHMDKYEWNREFKEYVIIFDDMRYLNELELITDLGGTTIFVDGASRLKDMGAKWRMHESEKMAMMYTYGHLPDVFDYYITNHHGEQTLKELVDHLAPAWLDMEIMS